MLFENWPGRGEHNDRTHDRGPAGPACPHVYRPMQILATMMSGPRAAAAVANRGQARASASSTVSAARRQAAAGIGIAVVSASAKTVRPTSD